MYKTAAELWEEHITSFDCEVKDKACDIFVDGGCGRELFVNRYSSHFRFCIGIDMDLEECNRAKENIHYMVGDLENLPLKTSCVDVFLINFVLEHIRNPINFFLEVNRVMKANGKLIIWVPNMNSISGIIIRTLPFSLIKSLKKTFYGTVPCRTHYRSNNPSKLDSMLNNVGFKKVKMEMKDGVFYLSNFFMIRWFHTLFITITDREGFNRFKDLIFAVYLKC